MAHLSRDPQLLAALAPDQADPFVALAAQWLRLSQQQVGRRPLQHAQQPVQRAWHVVPGGLNLCRQAFVQL